MGKALEEGGDSMLSSENLASAFLMLGITESPALALLTFGIADETEKAHEPEVENEPATYKAALKSPQADMWKEAMRQEWQALIENHTFDVVRRNGKGNAPSAISTNKVKSMEEPIGCKWIYQKKTNPDGSTRYKARLVIKGYEQKEGIDYDETYAPVSKMATFRLLLALSAQHGWNVNHMDVVTAFLNPKID